MARLSLLLHGPGYLGGTLLAQLLSLDLYDITVMARSAEQCKILRETFSVKVVQTGGTDGETGEGALRSHDIIVNAANCDDTVFGKMASEAVLAFPFTALGTQRIFIEVSGADVFGAPGNPHQPRDVVYDDAVCDIMDSVADTAPHRPVDLMWRAAAAKGTAKIAIFIPVTIYGRGTGPFNTFSIQIPWKIQQALETGYVPYGGDGSGTLGTVHVVDCAESLVILIDALVHDKVDVSVNPYFNCTSQEPITWGEIARHAAKVLHAKGAIKEPKAKSSGRRYDFAGPYVCKSTRLEKLGWKAREDILKGVEEDVERVLAGERGRQLPGM